MRMRASLFFLGLILVCVMVSNAELKRVKREEHSVPRRYCRDGVWDDEACNCQCNFVGPVPYGRFCMATRAVCALRGKSMAGNCCAGYNLGNLAFGTVTSLGELFGEGFGVTPEKFLADILELFRVSVE